MINAWFNNNGCGYVGDRQLGHLREKLGAIAAMAVGDAVAVHVSQRDVPQRFAPLLHHRTVWREGRSCPLALTLGQGLVYVSGVAQLQEKIIRVWEASDVALVDFPGLERVFSKGLCRVEAAIPANEHEWNGVWCLQCSYWIGTALAAWPCLGLHCTLSSRRKIMQNNVNC